MEERAGHAGFLIQIAFSLIVASLSPAACSHQRLPDSASGDPVLGERKARDAFFRSNPRSPIPDKDRAAFKGLEYYPIQDSLRFRVRLHRYPVPEKVQLATNTGELRDGLKYGYFEFQVQGNVCRLQVYRMEDSSDSGRPYLFLPFRDATTGVETYPAGRYLDLIENTSGIYDLDFNRAYNPYCAYNEEFSCPIPPEANRLSIPVRAGEKNYAQPRQQF